MSLRVIKYSARWCQPCVMMKPIVAEVAKQSPDVEFVDVDIDENPVEATRMNVRSIPTFVFMKDDVAQETVVGTMTAARLLESIERLRG